MIDGNVPANGNLYKRRLRVLHHGVSDRLGAECAVLEDGRRGYVQRSVLEAIGMHGKNPGNRFRRFLADIAPNALEFMDKSGYPIEVVMPHGGFAKWVEIGILTKIASGVVQAAIAGRLGAAREHLAEPCQRILEALGDYWRGWACR